MATKWNHTNKSLKSWKGVIMLLIMIWLFTTITSKESVSIIFGGDVTFGGVVKYLVRNGRCKSYNETLQRLKPYLKADFVIVNLECVLRDSVSMKETFANYTSIHITADPLSISALKFAGIDYVTLANNHITDLEEEGVNFTTNILNANGIGYFGISYGKTFSRQKPLILNRNGVKIGLLGYCAISDCLDVRERLNAGMAVWKLSLAVLEIKELRQDGCDVIIIYMHWSNEYTSMLGTAVMYEIIKLQQQAPVELIVGSHPHTKHYHFYYNNTLIASSLGNLLFYSHLAGSLNFNLMDHNVTPIVRYEKIWAKQSRTMKNPSSYGKLLKVEVNRNGIIPEKTEYLKTEVFPTSSRNCLVVDKMKGKDWTTVCGKGDPECMGTRTCNVLECDGYTSYPSVV